MAAELVLGPDETVPGKPFVDPVHTQQDQEAMGQLLENERERARVLAGDWFEGRKDVVIRETDPEGLRHLLVVPDTRALLEARSPTVVGFFGRPRLDADVAGLFWLEEELVAGMGAYTAGGLLSYYDLELVKGAYGNLILFATPDGPGAWRENPVHRRAVDISPGNYHEIRLHQGTLSGGLLEPSTLSVLRTRYLDYNEPEVWRAVRFNAI
ncbi:MAG TPA: hypothetical protein VES61_05540 [Gaiellaceae bacterium]|nr:hypothetical protein [Gaiellaceae bacterium]